LTIGSSTVLARITRNVERYSETIGVRRVDFPLAAWDPFLNVNTPADLEVARSQADPLRTEGRALG
jgi:molybdopterin-guanine dinucleotide biosynthesis protein A